MTYIQLPSQTHNDNHPESSHEPMSFVVTPDNLPSVKPGQVWRARWDDVLTLVFVDTVLCEFAHRVRVAPVTMGDEDADDSALVLPAGANNLGTPLSVWPELVADISEIVLERWIAVVSDFSSISALEEAAAAGTVMRGLPILNDASPRWEERRFLELAMEVLSSAVDLAGGDGALPGMLTGISSSELADKLEVSLSLARNIKRARALVGFAQAEKLAELVGVPVQRVLSSNPEPPQQLVALAARLDRGPAVRALARTKQEPESDAFRELVQGAWGLAARGDKLDAEDWAGRLDTYIRVALDDR